MASDPKDFTIHDEVLVEFEIDGQPQNLPTFVTNVQPDELWLALRTPDARLMALEPGQCVHLTFNRGGGALVVESEFLRRFVEPAKLGMEKSRLFAVARPQGVDQVQRRAHVRVDIDLSVHVRSFGAIGSGRVVPERTVNVGAGGLQFITELPLMFGDQVGVALVLPGQPPPVIASGPVVRIDEVPATPQPGADPAAAGHVHVRVAVRFDRISQQDQERITGYILAAHRRRASSRRVAREEEAAAEAVARLEVPPAESAAPEPAPEPEAPAPEPEPEAAAPEPAPEPAPEAAAAPEVEPAAE